jgi:hypothetical protein
MSKIQKELDTLKEEKREYMEREREMIRERTLMRDVALTMAQQTSFELSKTKKLTAHLKSCYAFMHSEGLSPVWGEYYIEATDCDENIQI